MAGADRDQSKAWARERFAGAENIIMPSFTADLSALDEEGIRHDVRQSIRHGVFSVFCAVEVGLSHEEKLRFLDVAVDEAGGRVCVGFPLQGDSVQENLELLRHAERAGVSHAMVSYPQDFAPRTDDAVVRYHEELAEATDLPLVLFHNDKFDLHHLHPSGLPFGAYDRIVGLDTVVAAKVSVMDLATLDRCFERYGDHILVSTPSVMQLPLVMTHYEMQWTGAWTIEAFQTPRRPLVIELLEALRTGRPDEAMAIFGRLGPMFGELGPRLRTMMPSGSYHWTLFKYLQYLTGGNGGVTRQPAMRLTQTDMAQIRGAYVACGLDVDDEGDECFRVGRTARRRAAFAG